MKLKFSFFLPVSWLRIYATNNTAILKQQFSLTQVGEIKGWRNVPNKTMLTKGKKEDKEKQWMPLLTPGFDEAKAGECEILSLDRIRLPWYSIFLKCLKFIELWSNEVCNFSTTYFQSCIEKGILRTWNSSNGSMHFRNVEWRWTCWFFWFSWE